MAEIKLSTIKKEAKKLEEKKKWTLAEGQEITIYPNFSYNKIQELIKDLILFGAQSFKLGDDTLNDPLKMDIFINFLTIKHFTSLQKELKGKSYEVHVATMMEMIAIGWYQSILSAFDKNELNKVMESAYNSIGTLKGLAEREVKKDEVEEESNPNQVEFVFE